MQLLGIMLDLLKVFFNRTHLALLFKVYLVFMAAAGFLTAVAFGGPHVISAFCKTRSCY